jgi:OPA family glycerol-3-phosphate transporter-like MFS transporter
MSRTEVIPEPVATPPAADSARPSGEALVIWVIWLTYGSFYFCRQNIAAAVPGLTAEGLTETQVGFILGAMKIAYAIGQLVNGQLAERWPARGLLACGMLGSALLNVVFGLAEGLYFLLFIWACNGYCQALGWTPCIRVAANWIPNHRRGRALGIIGTSYQFMAGITYLIAGWSAYWFGWRGALFVPAILLIAAAVHMLLFLREAPHAEQGPRLATAAPGRLVDNLHATLTNPALWVLAICLALLDACRYGFQDWGLAHLKDVQGANIGVTAAKYAVLPAGGIVGALFSGWATDRLFAGRRAPVIVLLLLLLGGLTLAYDGVARSSVVGTIALLFGVGFAIFGPQVLLVGTAPTDLARRGTAAAAAGFVNFMGYMGAFAGDQMTGYLKQRGTWSTAITFWAACAFAAASVALILWNVRPRQGRNE